jgi:hypothetical protein
MKEVTVILGGIPNILTRVIHEQIFKDRRQFSRLNWKPYAASIVLKS